LKKSENKTEVKDLKIAEESGIREAYFGVYEGEENNVMRGKVAGHLRYDDVEDLMTSGGNVGEKVMNTVSKIDEIEKAESYQELNDRTFTAFQKIAKEVYQKGEQDVLVVSHGKTMESILNQIDESKLREEGFENGSVIKINFDENNWGVQEVNEMKYTE